MHLYTFVSVFLLTGLLTCVTSNAADGSEMEILVVTATRTLQTLAETLAPTTVFTESDIEQSLAQDLYELLSQVPSADLSRTGGRGARTSLRLRGTESDHVLVLIDGVRSGSVSDGASALELIPLDQIERVEIVRGPRSSLYGAEAIGGVIQVFTKQGSEELEPFVILGAGSDGTRELQTGLRGVWNQTRFSVSASHHDTEGIDGTDTSGDSNDDADAFRETSVALQLNHSFDGGAKVDLSWLRNEGEKEFDQSFGGGDVYTVFDTESLSGQVTLPVTDRWESALRVSRFLDEQQTFSAFPSVFDTERDTAPWQNNIQLGPDQLLTLGLDYYNDQLSSSSTFIADERDNKAVFVQLQTPVGSYDLAASLREDDNEAYGHKVTGNLSLGTDLGDQLRLIASYGTAIKNPTFNDLYFPFTDFGFGFTFEGNPDLDPEESESVELELRGKLPVGSWAVNLYHTGIDNLIALTATTVENLNQARINGFEASFTTALAGWDVSTSLSITDPRNVKTDKILNRRARRSLFVDVSRSFGNWQLGASWKTQSARYDDSANDIRLGGYGLINLHGSYRFSPRLKLALKLDNLFEKEYTLVDGFRTPELKAFAALSYSL